MMDELHYNHAHRAMQVPLPDDLPEPTVAVIVSIADLPGDALAVHVTVGSPNSDAEMPMMVQLGAVQIAHGALSELEERLQDTLIAEQN